MIGKNQIQIAGTQFAAGLATSDFLGDGGIGVNSTNLSLIVEPGVVRAMPDTTPAQTGDAISGQIVASCESPEVPSTKAYRWFVDSSGNIFNCDDSSYANDDLSTLSNVSAPTTDMAVWTGADTSTYSYIYVSRSSDVAQLTVRNSNGTLEAVSSTWYSDTSGGSALTAGVPHPLLVFESNLWVGNGNELLSASDSSTAGVSITFNVNERINCLGIDPQTGLMMIGVRTVSSSNDIFSAQSFVYLFDGYSAKSRRKIPVDGVIESFKSVGATVFVGMNNTIGYWNGNGVTFMRRLYNSTISPSGLPYKNRVASFQNTLLVADGQYVLAYGDIGNGKKVWWPFYKHTESIDAIFYVGNVGDSSLVPPASLVAISSGSTLKYIKPMDAATAATAVFQTNNINFERPVFIRRARVFTTGITTTTGIGDVGLMDEMGTVHKPQVHQFVVTDGTRYVFDFDYGGLKLQTLQPQLQIDTQAFGIIRIVIYYDVAE